MDVRNPLQPKEHYEYELAFKLQRLRARTGKTQKTIADAAGIDESTLRNYELARRLPRIEHLPGLANALGVIPEALVTYDIDSLVGDTMHALMQIATTYGLEPAISEEHVFLSPVNEFMSHALGKWFQAYEQLCKNEDMFREDYELWKDNYSDRFDKNDFPEIYPNYDPSDRTSAQRYRNDKLALKLKQLRKRHAMTQADLATASGISEFTIRSYEQGKRLPRKKQLTALAEALSVCEPVLVFHYFGSPNQAVHALFQICSTCDIYPGMLEDAGPVLQTSNNIMCWCVIRWHDELEKLIASGNDETARNAYFVWEDTFDPDSEEERQTARRSGCFETRIGEKAVKSNT